MVRFHYISPPKVRQIDNSMMPTYTPRGQSESRGYYTERKSHPLIRNNS
jgi:hypothetical protein